MTRDAIERWLGTRDPRRPDALAEQMSRSLAACPETALAAAPSIADAMGLLGTWTLAAIAGAETQTEDLALELLAADAFVTYAFEAAAEGGLPIGPLALQLLRKAA